MRPILRPNYTGPVVSDYKSYLDPLIQAYGGYCSYCERADKLDVEHVAPASKNPLLTLSWTNLVLGCPRCNRDFKRSNNQDRSGHVWPDVHNTFTLLHYLPDGRVQPAAGLPPALQAAAQATIDLVCLDDARQPQKPLNLGRKRQHRIALKAKNDFLAGNASVDEIMDQAEVGFWSIWYLVFQQIPAVATALETLLPNTDIHRP
ncbi:HNH endonuclease [Pantoea cypripedii]|uniref:HNH nuclease domain-containing protein n=1 Tax=Pantoea cypripedii TaxID=55209 RepID=A0A1X1EZP5_PANCY|nr:HNH endonuclease [Pantoea cypripedii]MBP2195547.1 uncharacterized protein (TIGR02646 family) [Pantoea cypripedii]ORM95384.1 hypothetical protein HA50_19335 [Pantoea cypripedii]